MKTIWILSLVVLTNLCGVCIGAGQDIVLQGVYETALDLPRIYFLLQRKPGGPALGQDGTFEPKLAFLDTGASGILLSQETAKDAGVILDTKSRFVDMGAGGEETFNVSEPLYLGLANGGTEEPENKNGYKFFGPGRFQVKQTPAGMLGEPIDIVGMPAMAGRVVVLNSGATNSLGYFAADIKKENDSEIPKVGIKVALRLKNCANPRNPQNTGPLPVMAYNPVIDGIVIRFNGKQCEGNWLLDTGATVSFISTRQAYLLGLVDEKGVPKVKPAFSVPIGGVGKMIQVQGFEIDELRVPTLSGNSLVFKKARVGVHDVRYFDEETAAYVVLDGVFGSNFLCASAKLEGLLPSDISETPFEHIVLDMPNKTLGFDVRDTRKKP